MSRHNVCLCCRLPCGFQVPETQECLAGDGWVPNLELVCWFIYSTKHLLSTYCVLQRVTV